MSDINSLEFSVLSYQSTVIDIWELFIVVPYFPSLNECNSGVFAVQNPPVVIWMKINAWQLEKTHVVAVLTGEPCAKHGRWFLHQMMARLTKHVFCWSHGSLGVLLFSYNCQFGFGCIFLKWVNSHLFDNYMPICLYAYASVIGQKFFQKLGDLG